MRRALAAMLPIGALAMALGSVPLPFYGVAPGPAEEVQPLIDVSGHAVYGSRGRFLLTSVNILHLDALDALGAWIDPARSIVPERDILSPGESEQQETVRARSEMDQSKIDAVYAVLSRLTRYPKLHCRGALVESVVEGLPAEGKLFPGDVILSIDGAPVGGRADAARIIRGSPAGEPLHLAVETDGARTRVVLAPVRAPGVPHPVIGVSLVDNFPFDVRISSGDIGGPSAGLMWALALYDLLTPGDLTGGRVVAGTGAIDTRGRIYPIGGIEQKISAAKAAGAEVFMVPPGNLEQARTVAGDLPLVPVRTLDEGVRYLRETA